MRELPDLSKIWALYLELDKERLRLLFSVSVLFTVFFPPVILRG